MLFLICLEELHSLESPNSFIFQLQLEGGSNPLVSQATTKGISNSPILWLQPPMFSGYNRKVATSTFSCPILPPYSRSRMMEPLSTCHYEIYRYKPVPINLNHASTMHQLVPQLVINLYHKQVHQSCTPVPNNL
jgi:hypothetical protein